jgi:hypothetical protein
MVLGKLDINMKKTETWLFLSPSTKVKLKYVKDLTVRPKTLKLLGESLRETLQHIGAGNNFLGIAPKHRKQKQKWTDGIASN